MVVNFVEVDITDVLPLHVLMHFTKEEVKEANDELFKVQELARRFPQQKFCFEILNQKVFFNYG